MGRRSPRPGDPGTPLLALPGLKRKERKFLHDKLEKLFTQKGGCTMHDTYNAGYAYPAAQALKMFEKRGYKVSTKKEPG